MGLIHLTSAFDELLAINTEHITAVKNPNNGWREVYVTGDMFHVKEKYHTILRMIDTATTLPKYTYFHSPLLKEIDDDK